MAPTALFVVDIQRGLLDIPKTKIPHAERIRKVATIILAKARSSIDGSRNIGEEPRLSIVVIQHEEGTESGTEPWELVFPPREGDATERLVSKSHSEIPNCTYHSSITDSPQSIHLNRIRSWQSSSRPKASKK
jgi:hypothetical protein